MKSEVQDALSLLLTSAPDFSDQTAILAKELERMEGTLRVIAEKDPEPEWSLGLRTSIVTLARNTLGIDE